MVCESIFTTSFVTSHMVLAVSGFTVVSLIKSFSFIKQLQQLHLSELYPKMRGILLIETIFILFVVFQLQNKPVHD